MVFHLHLHFTHNHSQRVLLSFPPNPKQTGLFCYIIKKARVYRKKSINRRNVEHLQCFVLNSLLLSKSAKSPFFTKLPASTITKYHELNKLWCTTTDAITRTDTETYRFRLFHAAQQPRRPNSNTPQRTFRWNDCSTKAGTREGSVGQRYPEFCPKSCKQEKFKVIYITCVSAEEQEARAVGETGKARHKFRKAQG